MLKKPHSDAGSFVQKVEIHRRESNFLTTWASNDIIQLCANANKLYLRLFANTQYIVPSARRINIYSIKKEERNANL